MVGNDWVFIRDISVACPLVINADHVAEHVRCTVWNISKGVMFGSQLNPKLRCRGIYAGTAFQSRSYVYVFNTTYTDCCCPNYYGQDRCAEWEALAYDTIMQSFTSGDKTDFLADYGYPGTFHACWHSPLKDQVVLVRSFYGEFLMAPTLAFIFGVLGLRNSFLKIDTYRESANLFDKLTGKIDTSSSERKTEDMSLNFRKKEADDEAEDD